ncbi:YbjQ family protein [Fibrobacterota bacterium]
MELFVIICLIILGYVAGTRLEARHYRSIEQRERELLMLPIVSDRSQASILKASNSELVYGSVVISIDYFKRILAGLRNLFGGAVVAYETLLDRARREALLRMKEMAPGASMIVNVRIETSSISKSTQNNNLGSIEVLAYGTALWFEEKE